jgi:hypothetical protein
MSNQIFTCFNGKHEFKYYLCRNVILNQQTKLTVSNALIVISNQRVYCPGYDITHQSTLSLWCGLWLSLCVIHKEGLCPSSENINRLMSIT